MKKISILHISDIHKGEGMSLKTLLNSLIRDRERWEEESIKQPDYIVLSGDVVQGGATEEVIAAQYSEAESFLSDLCKEFLGNHRERMIIVPGNHDVSWPFCDSCMEPVEVTPENMVQYSKHKDEDGLRWEWSNTKLFKVRSMNEYVHRFDRFVEFYNRFYDGIRQYPSHPELEAQCIPFDSDHICFACFNSCYQNDRLNDAGAIHKDAIYSIESELRKYYNRGMLPIGVWHHNAYGGPYQSDYMSTEVLDKLLEHRIKIGLFGHQHKSQIAEEYSDLLISEENRKRLLLISSGTLYGGDSEQHRGIRRQFNIVELVMENGQATVLVHVREDENHDVASDDPFWKAKSMPDGVIKYHVKYKHVTDEEILRRIDDETRRNDDFVNGIMQIRFSGINNDDAHKLIDVYLKMLDSKDLLYVLPEPETDIHCFLLMGAIDKEHDAEAYERLKNSKVLHHAIEKDKLLEEQFICLSKKF
jgi:predicted phosphodiesterase